MADSLDAIEEWAGTLLARLAPAERNTLARTVAQKLRRSQQQRIVAQRNPDGSAFKARKPRNLRGKQGRIKRNAKMFQKLRTARLLKAKGDSNAVALSFAGRVALIARVHQYGLKDRAQKGAPDSRYPRRRLLGFMPADVDLVRDELLKHLTARQV